MSHSPRSSWPGAAIRVSAAASETDARGDVQGPLCVGLTTISPAHLKLELPLPGVEMAMAPDCTPGRTKHLTRGKHSHV